MSGPAPWPPPRGLPPRGPPPNWRPGPTPKGSFSGTFSPQMQPWRRPPGYGPPRRSSSFQSNASQSPSQAQTPQQSHGRKGGPSRQSQPWGNKDEGLFWLAPDLLRAAVCNPWAQLEARYPDIVVSRRTQRILPQPELKPAGPNTSTTSKEGAWGSLQNAPLHIPFTMDGSTVADKANNRLEARIQELEQLLAAERERNEHLQTQLRALQLRLEFHHPISPVSEQSSQGTRFTLSSQLGSAEIPLGPRPRDLHASPEDDPVSDETSDVEDLPEDEVPPYMQVGSGSAQKRPFAEADSEDSDDDSEDTLSPSQPIKRLSMAAPQRSSLVLPQSKLRSSLSDILPPPRAVGPANFGTPSMKADADADDDDDDEMDTDIAGNEN